MDNNTYVLTSDGELYHYGVPGMKWGVRRTPTQLGHKPSSKKKKVSKGQSIIERLKSKRQAKKAAEEERKKDLALRNKKVSEMSDDELRQHLNRVRMEREAYQIDAEISRLNPKKVSAGKKFIQDFKEKALGPAAVDAGKKLMSNLMNKAVDKALGDAKDPLAALKKEAEKAGYKQIIANAKSAAEKAKWQEQVTRDLVDKSAREKKERERLEKEAERGRSWVQNTTLLNEDWEW